MSNGLNLSFRVVAIDDFSRVMNNLESQTKKAVESIGAIGTAVTGMSIAGGIALGGMVKTAADFESAIDRVGALSGATGKDMEALTKTAKELGETTSFSASQAAEGMSYLAMAGYDTNEMIAAMPGLLSAAAAGQTDLGTTADITSNILSGFGLAAGETARVADVLTKTFTSSNTDLAMLGETMKYVAPTANAMGLSLEEVAAAAGILGNAGIQGSMAGTSLSMSLTRLASPAKEAAEMMEEIGFNAFDTQGQMLPLTEIIGGLAESTSDLTDEQKMNAISTIFGAESMKSMLTLLDAGEDSLYNYTAELKNAGGTADKIANQQLDNLNGQFTILKSGVEAFAISIGEALMPAVRWLASGVQSIVEKFNGLSPQMKNFIAMASLASVAMGLFIGPLMMLIPLIPSITGGLTAIAALLKITTSQLLIGSAVVAGVVLAIAALGVAFYLAYQKIDAFRVAVDGAWAWIKEAFNTSLNFIKGVVANVMSSVSKFFGEKLGEIKAFWDENGKQIMAIVKFYFTYVKGSIEIAMSAIKAIFQTVWPIISGVVKIAWEVIKTAISNALALVLGIISAGMKLLKGDWKGAWEDVKQTAKTIMENIIGFFEGIDLYEIGSDIIQGLVNGISGMIGTVKRKVEEIAALIPQGVKDFLGINSPIKKASAETKKKAAALAMLLTQKSTQNKSINLKAVALT